MMKWIHVLTLVGSQRHTTYGRIYFSGTNFLLSSSPTLHLTTHSRVAGGSTCKIFLEVTGVVSAWRVQRSKLQARMSRQPAIFFAVPEIQAYKKEDLHDRMVRTVGRLLRYDTKNSLVWLGHYEPPYLELAIDCSLVQPFPYSRGALYQFIGEVDGSGRTCSEIAVRALAYRRVERLNMAVYIRALAIRNSNTLVETPSSPWRQLWWICALGQEP